LPSPTRPAKSQHATSNRAALGEAGQGPEKQPKYLVQALTLAAAAVLPLGVQAQKGTTALNTNQPAPSYNAGMVQPAATPTNEAAENFRIELRSYQVAKIPLMGPAAHNELVFLHKNKVLMAINGDPYNRTTGALSPPTFNHHDTLRVSILPENTMGDKVNAENYPLLKTTELFSGREGKFAELAGRAMEAAHSINNSNIDYIMFSPIFTAQNSNSVAYTLMQAMGLQVPAGTDLPWAPGHGRLLLPDNFTSRFDNVAQMPNWLNDARFNEHQQFIGRSYTALRVPEVGAKVRQDPNPHTPQPDLWTGHKNISLGRLFDSKAPLPISNSPEPGAEAAPANTTPTVPSPTRASAPKPL